MSLHKPFRYSGSKTRYVKEYRRPPNGTKYILEPYAGSMAYSLFYTQFYAVGIEKNRDLCEVWWWLQSCDKKNIDWLEDYYNNNIKDKDNLKDHRGALSVGQINFLRLMCASVVVGQLSSWTVYKKHGINWNAVRTSLDAVKNIFYTNGDAADFEQGDGCLIFLDPPYAGTLGNYKDRGNNINFDHSNNIAAVRNIIDKTSCPIIFTYGDGAPELFPGHDWRVVAKRKVPNLRRGGTVDRTEYVAYIRWPEE